jgi:hypothetical protein
VFVIDKTGEAVACIDPFSQLIPELTDQAKGDVNDVSTAEILKLEQSIKGDGVGAFKLGQR